MSPPRVPLARRGPGVMAATTLRVLAAEISDAGRLTRGRRLRADGAVTDLAVGHGAVVARVQGSRSAPYVVTLEVRPGQRAPTRRELTVRCTCPDDAGTGQHGCKHVVAALLGLADEVMIEPELLARWRRSDDAAPTSATGATALDVVHDDDELDDESERADDDEFDDESERADDDGFDDDGDHDRRGRRHQASSTRRGRPEVDRVREHPLSILMQAPGRLPPMPVLSELVHPPFPDPLLDQVLAEARDELHIRWD